MLAIFRKALQALGVNARPHANTEPLVPPIGLRSAIVPHTSESRYASSHSHPYGCFGSSRSGHKLGRNLDPKAVKEALRRHELNA